MKYEKWSLGYAIVKVYVILAHRLVHKKIIVTGKKNVPKNKPVVFAPNHQNALSDPLAVLTSIALQPVWLARADIFQSKFARPILRFLKIMPVYRIRDGKERLSKNEKTFSDSIKVLENNKVLALFPEAAHSGRRHSIPHKKAVPRIVFMAEEKNNFELDTKIVPVGIYYGHYWKFGRNLIVNFGKPIAVKDYIKDYQDNQQAAIIALRDEIRKQLLPLTLDIRSTKFYDAFEEIRSITVPSLLKEQHLKNNAFNQFKAGQELVTNLDKFEKEQYEKAEQLANKALAFSEKVKKLKLRNWVIAPEGKNPLEFLLNIWILAFTFPFFLYGFLFNAIPFFAIDSFVRTKIKDPVFWSTFSIVLGLVLFPAFYLTILAIAWPYLPAIWHKLVFMLSLPILGRFSFFWFILFRKTIGRWRMLWLAMFNKDTCKALLAEKTGIIKEVCSLK